MANLAIGVFAFDNSQGAGAMGQFGGQRGGAFGGQFGGQFGCEGPRPHHHHRHHHREEAGEGGKPEAPERNPFLDFATAPLQALGLKKGNQNDKNYDHYLQATQAGNAFKGF